MNEKTLLRRGWTTGACAAAAARAAFEGLATGAFPDPVSIRLPGGQCPAFALAVSEKDGNFARAGIVKDAGDDPDVTHGALIIATLRWCAKGEGVLFKAGEGVGTITRPGLPLPPGEPAINPMPRKMIGEAIAAAARRLGVAPDVEVEISIPGGEKLAERTLNGRLGIIGGLSILGTTGIVIPFSCAAWIDSIHRGVDVARASGAQHIAASTGSTSENAVRALYGLPDLALIEMGDFVGGFLKYIRAHPVARVTLAGGFAKMSKLGQGMLDLHSRRGAVDRDFLASKLLQAGAAPALANAARTANSALEILRSAEEASIDLPSLVADAAYIKARNLLGDAPVKLDIAIFARDGVLLANTAAPP